MMNSESVLILIDFCIAIVFNKKNHLFGDGNVPNMKIIANYSYHTIL